MRFKITALGGSGRPLKKIASDIVNYLRPRKDQGLSETTGVGQPAAYYADGGDEPGRWMGRGAAEMRLHGTVEDHDFAKVLEGRDPMTGERLITAQGSAGRRLRLGSGSHTRLATDGTPLYDASDAAAVLDIPKADAERLIAVGQLLSQPAPTGMPPLPAQPAGSYLRPTEVDGQLWVAEPELARCARARDSGTSVREAEATGDPDDLLPIAEAARIAGVSVRYMRKIAKAYADDPSRFDPEVREVEPSVAFLVAQRGPKKRWIVRRQDLIDFIARRKPPSVNVAFDLALTTEKSLGVLGLLSPRATRTAVLAAVEAGNDWGLSWLEDCSAKARANEEVVPARGWTVASFRHYTSRALDPFPHHHNVIANTVEDNTGTRRALDARPLYFNAEAASALATAEMRYRLTKALGVRWRLADKGHWEIAGIPDAVLGAFSQRRNEIEDAVNELEEAIGRGLNVDEVDHVVRGTRPPKSHEAVDELFCGWWLRAQTLGFTPDDLDACVAAWSVPPEPEPEELFNQLVAPDGLCCNVSVFNRGDVMQALVNLAIQSEGEPEPHPLVVPATRLEELADEFLARTDVALLTEETERKAATYSTREMLGLQGRLVSGYENGLSQGQAVVPDPILDEVLHRHPRLTDEQVELVRAFCTSGHHVQTAIGRPGAGKTTSMRVAREAWEAAGRRVLGTAVKGEAARTLSVATGIPTETLAWHLAHDDPVSSPLDARTVLVVDEASTVSDRDLDRLFWLARQGGATLRLIGDPKQHGAVEAGGMFRVLCDRHPDQTPELSQTHRLRDPHDRAAADALREGQVVEALRHLARAGHLHIVEDEIGAYIQVLSAWWRAHVDGLDHPMVDRRNAVRHTLNRLAHALRDANGELGNDCFISDTRRFAVGDRVIARRPDRQLRAGGDPSAYVRNGAIGSVVAIRSGAQSDDDSITVAFDSIGTIELPRRFVDERDDAPDRRQVGLDYAYAVTSYAVTGATQPLSTSLIDERSSRAEAYVDITRGEEANHLYLTRAADPLDGEHLPRVPVAPIAEAVADRLRTSQGEKTAWEIRQDQLDRAAAPPPPSRGLSL